MKRILPVILIVLWASTEVASAQSSQLRMLHRQMARIIHAVFWCDQVTDASDRKERLYRDLVASSAKLQATGWLAVDDPV